MSLFNTIVLLLTLTAGFAYVNTRLLRLPDTIGLMIVSLVFSVFILIGNGLSPAVFAPIQRLISQIDYTTVVLDVMLSSLLFAGAFHTDLNELRKVWPTITLFALVGVVFSTGLIAAGLYGLLTWLSLPIDWLSCLLFGALISPTDPIAVLGILTRAKVSKDLEIKIVGESLFNDGVGVVIFLTLIRLVGQGAASVNAGDIALLFGQEALGGILFGLLLGGALFYLLRSIDHYQTEVLLTIAAVLGGYSVAAYLHVSGPLAMVVVGLMTGHRGKAMAMSAVTEEYVSRFWELIDVILNAVLFVLVGFRLMSLQYTGLHILIGACTVGISLLARYLSIWLPMRLTLSWLAPGQNDAVMMTWGGLRGGLSIAMALSIPESVAARDLIIVATYAIVLFSIIVQGLTLERVARRLHENNG